MKRKVDGMGSRIRCDVWLMGVVVMHMTAGPGMAYTATNRYHTNRVFRVITSSIPGTVTAYKVYDTARRLTTVVGPTNVLVDTNRTVAREYEVSVWGYGTAEAAWGAVVASVTNYGRVHTNVIYGNAGWVKGTQEAHGEWGGYLWWLENEVAFETSATNIWVSPYGVTNYIAWVLVGTIGDYEPMTNVVDRGPRDVERLTNYAGAGVAEDALTPANYRAFYVLLKVEIEEVGFTGDHLITEWPSGTAIDFPDGTSPTWKKIGNPDKPVAYTKGAQPTAFGKVSVSPDTLGTTLTADFRVKVNGNVVATKNGVQLDGTTVSFDNISFSSALETTVKKTEPVFEWEMKLDGVGIWTSVGSSGPHTFYWTHGTPIEDPLYDLALEKVCTYADGQTTAAGSSAALRSGIHGELGGRYSPSGTWKSGSSVLEVYGDSCSLICSTYANLTAYLNRTLGISASVIHVWAGTSTQGYVWQYTGSGSQPPNSLGTILVDPGSWLWAWHAVADTAEGYSDAALGVQGVDVVHHHPNATVQYKNVGDSMTTQHAGEVDYIFPDPLHVWP